MNKIIFPTLLISIILSSCATQKQPEVITKVVKETVEVEKRIVEQAPKYAQVKGLNISTQHYPAVGQDNRVRHLVLHYTAIDKEASIRALTQQQVSSHYLVSDIASDPVYVLVDEDKRAWHAGVSSWKGINNINYSSIGIEIVNLGGYTTTQQRGDWEGSEEVMIFYDYPKYQIDKVGMLARDIVDRYGIEPQNVVGHSDVAPQRKPDPGAKFPWKRLYDEFGVGAWYEEMHKDMYISQYPYDKYYSRDFIVSVQKDLEKYGYGIEITGDWDRQTRKVITVFQHHFRPEKYDGYMDAETWAILQALILKYRS